MVPPLPVPFASRQCCLCGDPSGGRSARVWRFAEEIVPPWSLRSLLRAGLTPHGLAPPSSSSGMGVSDSCSPTVAEGRTKGIRTAGGVAVGAVRQSPVAALRLPSTADPASGLSAPCQRPGQLHLIRAIGYWYSYYNSLLRVWRMQVWLYSPCTAAVGRFDPRRPVLREPADIPADATTSCL